MPLKLLIADDERLFRQSLKILLETAKDIKVVAEAADGQEAVVKCRETEPDIALLDVRMPKMDGIKAAKLIAALTPERKFSCSPSRTMMKRSPQQSKPERRDKSLKTPTERNLSKSTVGHTLGKSNLLPILLSSRSNVLRMMKGRPIIVENDNSVRNISLQILNSRFSN